MTYCLAVDPGKVSGWSYVQVGEDKPAVLVDSGQTENYYQGLIEQFALNKAWANGLGQHRVNAVLCEDFILRRGQAYSSDQTAPERGIGVMATCAALWKVPFTLITPAQNKKVSDAQIEALGLSGPAGHANRHQRDATRLIVGELIRQRHRPTLEALYPH